MIRGRAGSMSRRALVQKSGLLVVLPALAETASACARILGSDRRIQLPAPDKRGNAVLLKSQAPELAVAGGGVVVQFPPPQDGGPSWFPALVANTGSGLIAVQGACPHEACDLTWVQGDKEVECPCHGSRFATDGTLLNPPAATDLETYLIDEDETSYTLHLAPGDGTFPEPDGGGALTLNLADYPALQTAGGSVIGFPEGLFGPLIVVRENDATVQGLSGVCPHLGCYVQRLGQDFRCPCHGSQFQLSGSFIQGSGPADRSLARYDTSFDPSSGAIVIQIL